MRRRPASPASDSIGLSANFETKTTLETRNCWCPCDSEIRERPISKWGEFWNRDTSAALNPKFARRVAQALANFGFATLAFSGTPSGIELSQICRQASRNQHRSPHQGSGRNNLLTPRRNGPRLSTGGCLAL